MDKNSAAETDVSICLFFPTRDFQFSSLHTSCPAAASTRFFFDLIIPIIYIHDIYISYHLLISIGHLQFDPSTCRNNGRVFEPVISTNTGSIESLDCLLSVSNSQTEATSVEDDGVSLLFSDSNRSFWNFTPTRATSSSSNINFQQASSSASASSSAEEPDPEAIAQMKEIIYRAAAFRPVDFGAEAAAEKPRRKNVRISNDPQTVAARQRRERISERIRVLQGLVPGGSKMDTASMLDEAASYLKFLRSQVKALEELGQKINDQTAVSNYYANLAFSPFLNSYSFTMQNHHHQPPPPPPQFTIHSQNPPNN
ncbi:hypothetical protein MIMGU_mgv1a026402mg [Erythranthe guttata]|uniref:BHLH domain-containing protein n=1 Tax=Erythranthe guttata TaxID=4155 RepID=A0A022Q043_ERYGU|nr:hypothetical protein MIMGU_mgv1a026402mg [Erythranthe guttata]